DEALLLAVEGVRLDDSRDTRANLLAAVSKTPTLVGTLRSDTGLISAAVSPDNRIVAVTHAWADVEFFDIDTKKSLGRYDELTAASRVAFRPDGKQLAVGNQPDPAERTTFDSMPLRLVDPTTFAEQPAQLGGQPERSFTVAPDYSADGRFLAASFGIVVDPTADALSEPESSRLVVWDVTKPEQPVTSIDLPNYNYYPALSPDGSVVYVGHLDPSSVTAYDVASGRELMSSALPGYILTLSPDGTVLAAADGAEISLIDAATLQERIRLRRHTGNLGDVEFSADGALLASGADDNTALVWDVASGEIRQELNGHSGSVWGLAFTSDGSLVTSSLDETVHFWDIEGTRRFIPRSPSAEPLPVEDGWGFTSNDVIAHGRLEMPDAPGQPASAVLFRDVATGRVTALDTRHGGSGHWFAWRPDGRRFASVGADLFVRVWDWPTLQLVTEQQVLQNDAVDVDFTGDGTRLVVAESKGRVLTLDAESLAPAGPTIRLDTGLNAIKANPDNRTAIVFTSGYDYAMVDLDQGRVLRRGEIHFGSLPGGNGEFSPDGRRIAVTQGRRVRVMDVASGDWLGPPVLARINTISYAPDGSTFATGGQDGAVSLWDGNTGSLLGTVVPGAFEPDLWAHFLPDGHTVLIATFVGDVYTWDTRSAHWVDFACQVVGRNLTTEEWNAVFEDRAYRKTCPEN
ncbi:MAG TPA: WD40 repeat domain-containing protein, partial [Actinomycetes bacterium]|nr:WD40 repeat domain-containing protein [Actinomycetes bacterium]